MINNLNNKGIFKSISNFVCFLIVIYFVFGRITWIFRGNGSEAREDIYGFRNQGSVDVVLYAGSNLLRYYQPLEAWHQKGYTSYNYATSSAKADLLKAYIEDSRVSNDATLYVCDIRSFPMVIDTVDDSSLRNWSDSLPVFSPVRWYGISSFLFSRNRDGVDIPSYYFDIIKYHTNTDVLRSEYQWGYQDLGTIYNVDKGFDPNKGHIPFNKPKRVYDIGDLTNQQEKAVDDLLDYCDRNKLNVLFICCPYIITESDWLTINAVGEKITDRGYDFVNFNDYYDDIGLDFEIDFGDVNHVNYLGAEKYTRFLMDYLSDNYDLPDHRGDEEYKQWDEDYKVFSAYQKDWKKDIVSLTENHLNAKELGEHLSEETDYYEWYSHIKNSNYSTIVLMNQIPSYISMKNPICIFLKDYKIDTSHSTYIGVWEGDKPLVSDYDDVSANFNIGVDGGRGTVPCSVNLTTNSIKIGEKEYFINAQGIHIFLFDNNYQELIDDVLIYTNEDGVVELRRL